MLSTISRDLYYDLSFLTFDPKTLSDSEPDDKAGRCVVRANSFTQQVNALDVTSICTY
jgi:hypothetical protein